MMHQSFVSTATMGSGNNGVTFLLLKAPGPGCWGQICGEIRAKSPDRLELQ